MAIIESYAVVRREQEGIPVWDLYIRLFHWSLVIAVLTLYITGQFGLMFIHQWVGYAIVLLLMSRIMWGFVGSQYALFSEFSYSPKAVLKYLQALRSGKERRYIGHNPAGAMMVFALLFFLLLLACTGLLTLAGIDFDGPLLFLALNLSDETIFLLQAIHKIIGNYLWVVIVFHLGGVVHTSLRQKENLVLAMITGRKNQ